MTTLVGALVVAAAGLIVGSGGWPMKLMRQLQFEHWWFVGMLVGLIVMPWAVTQSLCPDALNALGSVDASVLIRSNLFALVGASWQQTERSGTGRGHGCQEHD